MKYEDAYKEIESLLKYGKQELKEYGDGEQLFIPDTLEALEIARNVLGTIQQIQWERDLATYQLKKLGYELGEIINGKNGKALTVSGRCQNVDDYHDPDKGKDYMSYVEDD